MPILTTRQIPAAIKAGRIKETYEPEGTVHCSKCGRILGDTASPRFWSKGSYCWCNKCNADTLAEPHYPDGLVLDLSR